MLIPRATEGHVPFRGYRTWYQVVGDISAAGPKLPLLAVHGGPGFPHDYLGDLARLGDAGRPVVFYDQLGCGKSDHPDDRALWVMETFVDELATVRAALGLDLVIDAIAGQRVPARWIPESGCPRRRTIRRMI